MSAEGMGRLWPTGRASVRVRARAHVEPLKGGREAIVVTELPFMVKKGGDDGLITKIADLVREKEITGISDLRDESDRSGMRLVIETKRGGDPPEVVLNQLYGAPDARRPRGNSWSPSSTRARGRSASRSWSALPSPTSARSSPAAPSTSCARRRRGRTSSRACSSPSTTSTR